MSSTMSISRAEELLAEAREQLKHSERRKSLEWSDSCSKRIYSLKKMIDRLKGHSGSGIGPAHSPNLL